MTLNEDMRRLVSAQGLGFVATVRPDGTPNLSPKGTTEVWDSEHLVFLDLHSPGTVANLAVNPAVEINVVDPVRRKGYRFRGEGRVHTGGETYDRVVRRFREQRGTDPAKVRSVVLVRVEEAGELISPAYEDGTSEAEIAARWRARLTAEPTPAPAAEPSAGPGAGPAAGPAPSAAPGAP
ncbi:MULTISPECIES: pyridoxamine 5'-phosphate oxidase family protein [unclassified Streptomyces]|uniref:pyridoxamine 5'-phosphate oxidase family protein n=1 Tax=unclassified Streptomyces TaxID=2593676 RepID=UPI0022B69D0F|nr:MULTISPECIES: pyridoxamine 5'-phosphate oxidase family protein [unclassified Streptomyces]MCZ7413972.1 pyridoxamine 5'-phosphate oxidase family protein [Streptomyces sp. WMMC897]MCZ7430968.1 pyridoxamine 5'-phosphate oxidase family protein [Streptomyces sp. WMMC1477]